MSQVYVAGLPTPLTMSGSVSACLRPSTPFSVSGGPVTSSRPPSAMDARFDEEVGQQFSIYMAQTIANCNSRPISFFDFHDDKKWLMTNTHWWFCAECSNSIINAMESLQSCTKPSIYSIGYCWHKAIQFWCISNKALSPLTLTHHHIPSGGVVSRTNWTRFIPDFGWVAGGWHQLRWSTTSHRCHSCTKRCCWLKGHSGECKWPWWCVFRWLSARLTVTPLPMHWSYCSLALSHWFVG